MWDSIGGNLRVWDWGKWEQAWSREIGGRKKEGKGFEVWT